MDLKIKNELFIVTGASSGLGKGVAEALLNEGVLLIAVARDAEKLNAWADKFPGQVEAMADDVTKPGFTDRLIQKLNGRKLSGVLINAGGPPAKSFLETELEDWDLAYQTILRWKVELTQRLIPIFRKQQYGRLLYIESESVKQPIENLVLSNSLRLAVIGFVKTLSQEIAGEGITLNVLAPGFHNTPAADRLFVKRSEVEQISIAEAKTKYEQQIKVGRMGNPEEFGMLATWMLSPFSGYITGQTISMDGGAIKGIMG